PSPNGDLVAFLASNGKGQAIRIADVNNPSKSQVIAASESFVRLLGWSTSEDYLIYATNPKQNIFNTEIGEVSVRALDLATGKHKDLFGTPSTYLSSMSLSPNKRQIAFVSRQDDVDNIWVADVFKGNLRKITENADTRTFLCGISWSGDDRTILYSRQTAAK